MAIKRVKISGTAYDLDNRLITLTATSGTLTTDQLAILQASSKNYIIYNNNIYNLTSKSTEEAYYGRVGTTEDQNFRIN